jgi:allantoate deiminase
MATDALAFVEIHIEQGPVLEAEGLSVAAVSAIVGQVRGFLSFQGSANHAGTTPMNLRRDALTAAAEWIACVEEMAQRWEGLVATVGSITAEPNASNVIPGSVRVSLDVRHAQDRQRTAAAEEMVDAARRIAERRGIGVQWTPKLNEPAVPMDERLTSFMTDAIESAGFPAKLMTSGAGHDAMVLASRVPTTMLFLRSPGGISHHRGETVRGEDVEAALYVGEAFLRRFAASLG